MAKSRKSNKSKDDTESKAADTKNDETLISDSTSTDVVEAEIVEEAVEAKSEVDERTEEPVSEAEPSEEAVADESDEKDQSEDASDDNLISESESQDEAPSDQGEENQDSVDTPSDSPEGEQGDDSLVTEEMDADNPEETTADAASSDAIPPFGEELEPANEPADVEPEKVPETPASKPEPTPAPAQKSGGMWPAVVGGVIAALLGFIAGRGDQLDQFLPASMQRGSVDLSAIEADIETKTTALAEANDALQARIAELESANDGADTGAAMTAVSDLEAATSGLQSVTTSLETSVAGLEASLATLSERIGALESAPPELPDEGATTDDVAALQAALDAQRAEIESLAERAAAAEAQAASEASEILARAALARVMTAVDSGEAYSPALADLEEVAPIEVPEPLRAAAEEGVPRLSDLQSSYPDAARAALAAVRAETPESEVQGVSGFLRRTLSARSVTPREGDDADAILSRAEAAVRTGDLTTALVELELLPEAGRGAMDEWLQAATARKDAQDAARALSDSLNN